MAITIISGTPGSGKSSLSRYLARQHPQGVHLETDSFFSFLPHRLDPSVPGSAAQNTCVVRAYLAAAREYHDGGFTVYVDGVIGPWWFDLIDTMLGPVDYLLLHAPLAVCLQRIADRPGQSSAKPSVATRMHEQFSGIVADLEAHTIDTGSVSFEGVVEEFQIRSGRRALRIPAVG